MSFRHAPLALTVIVLRGLNYLAAKVAVAEIPPIFALFIRFVLVSGLVLPFVRFPRGRFRRVAVLSTVLGTLHFSCFFLGLKGIDSGTAAIIPQLQVPLSSMLAAFVLGDRLGGRRLAGMAVAFVGALVVVGRPRFEGGMVSVLILIAGSLAFAVANILIKRLGPIDGFQLNGWMAFLALPRLLLVSPVFERGQIAAAVNASPAAWAGVLYSAVMSTLAAYGPWYWLLARHDVNQVVPFMPPLPFVSVAAGVLVLGEPPTAALAGGGSLTVVGVGVITLHRPAPADEHVPSAP